MNISDVIEAIRSGRLRITDHADEEAEVGEASFDEGGLGDLGDQGGPGLDDEWVIQGCVTARDEKYKKYPSSP